MTNTFKKSVKQTVKKTVLIVEDESSIAENIRYALETEGFDTIWVAEGREVEDIVTGGGADLVILDIGLPDINGMEICKSLRQHSEVPIIFLTARADEIDRVVGLEIGADDYMVKPFSPRELSARVKAVLRRYGNGQQVSEPARFDLDEGRCRISYCAEVLDLPRYEFGILSLLIRNPGRVYSREMLMDQVWDQPEMSSDRTVDAHIKNIRAKLKLIDPDCDPIRTHRSLGYSLREDI
ncbi:MAG: two-component system response regulator CreB [Desulfobacterales bacterium]|nr:two-component system response regulator CreB [Desulfobacterales bacterium]